MQGKKYIYIYILYNILTSVCICYSTTGYIVQRYKKICNIYASTSSFFPKTFFGGFITHHMQVHRCPTGRNGCYLHQMQVESWEQSCGKPGS